MNLPTAAPHELSSGSAQLPVDSAALSTSVALGTSMERSCLEKVDASATTSTHSGTGAARSDGTARSHGSAASSSSLIHMQATLLEDQCLMEAGLSSTARSTSTCSKPCLLPSSAVVPLGGPGSTASLKGGGMYATTTITTNSAVDCHSSQKLAVGASASASASSASSSMSATAKRMLPLQDLNGNITPTDEPTSSTNAGTNSTASTNSTTHQHQDHLLHPPTSTLSADTIPRVTASTCCKTTTIYFGLDHNSRSNSSSILEKVRFSLLGISTGEDANRSKQHDKPTEHDLELQQQGEDTFNNDSQEGTGEDEAILQSLKHRERANLYMHGAAILGLLLVVCIVIGLLFRTTP
ncbi:unknown protein [Seminavis robusta]|uniref:Uncharacterized protein n=1 Tax=Seminavis robusta TaxID=568900 RepID=A0A9N8EST9_9STRA|nr:unknown protein [Seminavis robusta]|eukprot:Sro1855_g301930.1 n/a (353) ;mRNA; f:8869-9927